MAGHSKWANIKHKKSAQDARRGKLFARLIRAIEAAARQGGADPDANPTLATAIQKAKDNSVPKDNIERALKRAAGKEGGGAEYEYVYYEGYAPSGVAVYVECLTDNKNRATNDVRTAFNKNGGNLADAGAVSYLFARTGLVLVPADQVEEDDILLAALDAGISEVSLDDSTYTVRTEPQDLQPVRAALEEAGIPVPSSEVTQVPSVIVPVEDEDGARQVLRLVDALEDCDDVQNVYTNFDIPERVLEVVA
ncbi:YebC/PmpR family DNA-binding transcriptional regulator [Egibacter rhizosphaerae]|uniref:Probable transcriptional regulatory protein ER308_19085 n=1 Tax=Egibacter rhizosphaerae TaxID=1670831 RepID=A0A411YJT9_9ACTN|nr:YebC/PmpR family DNA-binding transcriptional regulator [Egibacter rhizosphaerae]QBI21464.1 YebC/PmpR family DNA-binding transcriptional regulator [Egibacter rhizosphaerae]